MAGNAHFKTCRRWLLWAIVTMGSSFALLLPARAAPSAGLLPSNLFIQAGAGEEAQTIAGGGIWPWSVQHELSVGRLTGYWEASFGRWRGKSADGSHRAAWVTQLGITPVLRWSPRAWGARWFVEGGIGANLLLPIYRSRETQFSTSFNFGDHVGIGRTFGPDRRHELVLRLQHFSNGGIKKPNPGEEFLQLRYSWRY